MRSRDIPGLGDISLAGNNEAWTGLFVKIHLLPASEGEFCLVYPGFDVVNWPQAGTNEEGPFLDEATAESVKVPRAPSKPDRGHEKGLIFKAMEECTTADEVLDYFARYYSPGHYSGQYLVGDRSGNAAIIEPLNSWAPSQTAGNGHSWPTQFKGGLQQDEN